MRLARYFDIRSQFQDLAVVRSFLPADTRPARGNLANWGFRDPVNLDEFYNSVGFYLPAKARSRLIELRARDGSAPFDLALLKIFVSPDNENWQELGEEVEADQLQLNGRSVITITVSGVPARYWKFHFASSVRKRTFRANVDQMVQVYGYVK